MTRKKPAAPKRLRLEYRLPAELAENPANWREHPEAQQAALKDLLGEVGWAGAVLYNEKSKRLIDGHMRKRLADATPDQPIPVLIGSWDEPQEKEILATFDPLTAMATTSKAALDTLLADVQTSSKSIRDLLTPPAGSSAAQRPKINPEDLALRYSIVLDCATEADQVAILKELARHDLDARAVIAGFPATEKIKRPAKEKPLAATARKITRASAIARTPRVRQLEGLFDVPPAKRREHSWTVDLQLDKPWNLGLIVGPSGSGKTTIARELFGKQLVDGWDWPKDKAILDGFPAAQSIHEIVGLLSAIGFSSPPSWLKPFHVLSNGEQFRVNLARTLAEAPDLAVVDEFTSVVDRTVAQIASAALAKTIRASNRRFVAVTCHYDVEDWLQPDWRYDAASGEFAWRSLQRRPPIQLSIRRVDTAAWRLFSPHHYLDHDLNRAAKCFLGEVNGRPAAFTAVLHQPHWNDGWWREHRTVCLPDFQGVGLGNAMSEFVAGLFVATKKHYRSTTSHPAMIRHRMHSPLWEMLRAPSFSALPGASTSIAAKTSTYQRLTAGFQYVGPPRPAEAKQFGVL